MVRRLVLAAAIATAFAWPAVAQVKTVAAPTSPAAASEIDQVRAELRTAREALQVARLEAVQAKMARDVFERRWRGCEAAMQQDVQAAYAQDLQALQAGQPVPAKK